MLEFKCYKSELEVSKNTCEHKTIRLMNHQITEYDASQALLKLDVMFKHDKTVFKTMCLITSKNISKEANCSGLQT